MSRLLLLTFGLTLSFTNFAQTMTKTIYTAVPFLGWNNDISGAGMGMISVVATPNNYGAAMNLNPALLAREKQLIGGGIMYSRWGRSIGFSDRRLWDLNLYGSAGRWGFGLNARRFDWGINQRITRFGAPLNEELPQDQRISGNIAYQITNKLSLGVGLQWIRSEYSAFVTHDDYAEAISLAANFGLLYQNQKEINQGWRKRYSYGLSISNLGPKIAYPQPMPVPGFIPANLAIGLMQGWEYEYQQAHFFTTEFALQAQKLMVPSAGGESEGTFLAGALGSFVDAPFEEELASINWQFGIEARIDAPNQLLAAWRAGFILDWSEFGNQKLITLGASAGIAGFRCDISYLAPIGHNHPFQNTIRFGLSYQHTL